MKTVRPEFADNQHLAAGLEEIAELLDAQRSNPYRAQAYRNAAHTIRQLPRPVREILACEGTEGLTRLPGIGDSMARTLERLATTGHVALLEQLRGRVSPARKLATVPGIGPKTADRIYQSLAIDTLADLEAAAYDGRLANVPGMGQKRIRAVRESLAGRFRRPTRVPQSKVGVGLPQPAPIDELLSVDEEYRQKAAADRLLRIAPRRFNPTGEAWLPILHTHRGEHEYTALFSNSARAHELGAVRDWVVIYRSDAAGDRSNGQWTVVTSRFGDLKGRRIVRGCESECAAYYKQVAAEANTNPK
jgi:DNA polymerase (family 10)